MKKTTKLLALALALVLALGLAGCGAKTSSMTDSCYSERISSAPMEEPRPDTPMESESMPSASAPGGFGNLAAEDGGFYEEDVRDSAADIADMSEKIIYSADATLETTEFDYSIEEIRALVKELGGFMESSTISGNNYYSISRGNTGGRYASFLIRVPSDKFSVLTGSLSEFGNVPYCNTYMQNVTMEYYDAQSRLEAYKTQETRLLEMLAAAKSVEDMLAIQQQLTDVQYEIDSLTGQLRYYDHQVNYSRTDDHAHLLGAHDPRLFRIPQGRGRVLPGSVPLVRDESPVACAARGSRRADRVAHPPPRKEPSGACRKAGGKACRESRKARAEGRGQSRREERCSRGRNPERRRKITLPLSCAPAENAGAFFPGTAEKIRQKKRGFFVEFP